MNIIELAKQAGLHIATDVNWMPIISLEYAEKFAALVEAAVRADEREACAKFCETNQVFVGKGKRGFIDCNETDFVTGGIHQGMDYAKAIRARGTT